jgi:hypothetical protein
VIFKIVSGILAVGLLVVFIGPVAVKLKEFALIAVAAIGVGMAAIDFWQSLRSKDD